MPGGTKVPARHEALDSLNEIPSFVPASDGTKFNNKQASDLRKPIDQRTVDLQDGSFSGCPKYKWLSRGKFTYEIQIHTTDYKKMKEWIRRNLLTVLMSAGMIIGISLLLYPSVANYWNSFHQARTIMDYSEVVSSMNKDDYKKLLDEARAYNEKLAETGFKWTMTDAERQEYMRQLKVEGTDAMGYISIPKLHIKLPLMHGTDEKILQTSIGHLEETSLPVGGKGSHCVVSGHRGLPSSRLFTDIDKMKEGDTWTITVLNETLTYECDQIRIVLPEDLSNITLEKGKDLCTLVTCTPYGINTHRLLVRGHRVPNANGTADITADAIQIEPKYIAPFLAGPVLLILLILLLITTRKANRIDPEEILTEYLTGKGLKK